MFDDLDIEILKQFCKLRMKESISTWKLMRNIYKCGRDKEHNLVKARMERMSKFNLFKIKGNPKNYILDADKVSYKKFSFPGGRKIGIAIFIEGKWEIYEL